MSDTTQGGAAERACGEYEHWASEVQRLTDAIGGSMCPNESPTEAETHYGGSPSCFSEAADEVVAFGSYLGDEAGERRLSLDEIEARVADCPKCSELVQLIRARRHARKQFGIAKRRVRQVGKRIRRMVPA